MVNENADDQLQPKGVDWDMQHLGKFVGTWCFCIHPDVPKFHLPVQYLRENIISNADQICQFCMGTCLSEVIEDKRGDLHHLGEGFVYCPKAGKASRVSDTQEKETCPVCKEVIINVGGVSYCYQNG